MSFHMRKPMNWEQFKELPVHIQKEYIEGLQEKYHVTSLELGQMFGVKSITVRRHCVNNGLGISFKTGRSMNAAERENCCGFLNEETACEAAADTVCQEEALPELTEVQEPNVAVNVDGAVRQPKMTMRRVNLQFAGEIDVDMIANSLRFIFGNQTTGEVEINCSLQ